MGGRRNRDRAVDRNPLFKRFEICDLNLVQSFLNVFIKIRVHGSEPSVWMEFPNPLSMRGFDLFVVGAGRNTERGPMVFSRIRFIDPKNFFTDLRPGIIHHRNNVSASPAKYVISEAMELLLGVQPNFYRGIAG